jgi:putative DNA primase/helicase
MTLSNLPADMTERERRFVLWRRMIVHSREAKVPYSVGGQAADITDLNAFADFEDAVRVLKETGNRYAGIGFVFVKGDGMVGIDLDDVLDGDGIVKPWGRGVVERFADTYMEISPSGMGLKIWARGELPAYTRSSSIRSTHSVLRARSARGAG